jgi:hypothetical protein
MAMNIVAGEVRFSPARDLAYLWVEIYKNTVAKLSDERSPEVTKWLRDHNVTREELAEATHAFGRFIDAALEHREKYMAECLEQSGWFNVRMEVQLAFSAYMGGSLLPLVFTSIRDVHLEKTTASPVTVSTYETLISGMRAFTAYSVWPRWKRWLYRHFRWLGRLFMQAESVKEPW